MSLLNSFFQLIFFFFQAMIYILYLTTEFLSLEKRIAGLIFLFPCYIERQDSHARHAHELLNICCKFSFCVGTSFGCCFQGIKR